jgi:hypothetical protein
MPSIMPSSIPFPVPFRWNSPLIQNGLCFQGGVETALDYPYPTGSQTIRRCHAMSCIFFIAIYLRRNIDTIDYVHGITSLKMYYFNVARS